jgi:2-polyprenyl-6-methoxyphenol hydroxylase-like FAD-dependent oxidoreductase
LTIQKIAKTSSMALIQDNLSLTPVGESVNSSLYSALDYLGISHVINQKNSLTTQGYCSYWGGTLQERHQMFNHANYTIALDRYKFNNELLETLKNFSNSKLFFPYRLLDMEFKEDIWNLTILNYKNERKEIIKTPYIVDASGRRGFFARKAGAINKDFDHLVGAVMFYDIDPKTPISGQVITEPDYNGWWYMNFLPNNKIVIAFMTDPQELQKEQIYKPEIWNKKIQKTLLISPYFSYIKPIENKIQVHSAKSRYFLESATQNWIATGDAACAFDPLSSAGIGHAIVSGIHTAHAFKDKNYIDYSKNVEMVFYSYLENRKKIYEQEKRWKNQDFWSRRR